MPSLAKTQKPKVLVIVGPTCSGKTVISLELATRYNGEIVSADSRQVFKHLDIGTAKPSLADRERIKHHFVDELLPDQDFNAGVFGDRGRSVIQTIFAKGKLPIVVGGSGLYVRSLIDGFFEGPGADVEFREGLERQIKSGGLEHLLDELRRVDPQSADMIDPTKPRRIIRALEVYHLTGRPLSALHREKKVMIKFEPVLCGLHWQREALHRRIEERCDEMIAAGLMKEIDRLEAMGYNDSLNSLHTVGYAEGLAYRRGEISYEAFVHLFKQNSRRYAKRQMTWFRSDKRIKWFEMYGGKTTNEIAVEISHVLPDESSSR